MKKQRKWDINLEKLRIKEINIVFDYLGSRRFRNALELGAGNGFQSALLVDRCENLIATDMNEERLPKLSEDPRIDFQVLDAEIVGDWFEGETFDFIFSSNLMEHLPDVDRCLSGCHKILAREGVMINILPNWGWRLIASILYYPVKASRLAGKLLQYRRITRDRTRTVGSAIRGNNLKLNRKKSPIIDRLLPPPHGVSANSLIELYAFRRQAWIEIFQKNDFEVIAVLNGPISTGHGVGFEKIKTFFEYLGFTTEYIFVLKKR